MKDIKLHKRLLKLLHDHNEEHMGSCFSCVDIIDNIFENNPRRIFLFYLTVMLLLLSIQY